MSDTIVFWHHNGSDYAANIDGETFAWPAVAHGWLARKRVPESTLDACDEIADARLADLALRLSGAPS